MKNFKFSCLFFVGLLCFALSSWAQSSITVKGRVVDTAGESVIGASVLVTGTTIGTITDLDGNFLLSNVDPKASLEVSYIGYKTLQVKVNGQTSLTVTLKEDTQALEEVVVVGYGVQRKSDLTGAVTSIKTDDLLKSMPVSDISHALEGRIAGMSVVSGSGAPGSGATMRIRGMNSLKADGGPVVVIDGMIGGSLASLNASDIASIEVLKDASATAIYGASAANGVILVTTKNPEAGKVRVEYSGYVNFKTPYDLPDMLSPGEFADLANDYGKEYYAEPRQFYTPEEVAGFYNGGGFDYMGHIFRDVAIEHNHALSVSGGSEKTKFLFSTRFNYNDGIANKTDAQNFNYRLKVDSEIRSWLKAGFNFWGNYSKSNGGRFSQYRGVLAEGMTMANTILPTDEEGNYNNFDITGQARYNPMGMVNEVISDGYSYTSRLQGYVDVKLWDGLSFRMNQSVIFGSKWSGSTNNEKSYAVWAGNGKTSASTNFQPTYSWNNQNILTYIKEFNKNHRINATLVFEQSHSNNMQQKVNVSDLYSVNIGHNNTGFAKAITSVPGNHQKTSSMAALARVNYVFMDRYMLTASWRYDASSVLASGNKWEQFPSLALAWNVKQENFLQNVDFLSQLKLRLGYGQVGNSGVAAYSEYTQVDPSFLPDGSVSFAVSRLGQPDLKWERTEQWNLGFDMGFFNNRLTATLDLYHKKTHDMLLDVNAPLYTNFSSRLRNAGSMLNKGYEIAIGADPVVGNEFSWNTTLTLSQNQAIIKELASENDYITLSGYEAGHYRYYEGRRVGVLYGYVCEGVWTTEEAAKAPATMNAKPGTYRFKDLTGDDAITEADQTVIGNGQPRFQWGWNNSFRYKDFDFSFLISGVHGFDIYNKTHEIRLMDNGGNLMISPNPELLNRWTPENDVNTGVPGFVPQTNGLTPSSEFVENGSYVKIKNITLGYTLPKNLTQRMRISNLRVYLSLQNPFLISGYSGLDPEVALKSPLTPGIDYGYYPNGRNYLLGLNLAF